MADEPRGLNLLVERFTFANAAARTSAGPYFNQDIGKLAWQQDTQEYWRLTAISPLTWLLVSPGTDLVPGANTNIIYNNNGAFGADATLTYNTATGLLNVGGKITIAAGASNWDSTGAVAFAVLTGLHSNSSSTIIDMALRPDLKYIGMMSDGLFVWRSVPGNGTNSFFSNGVIDTGIARTAAGVIEANNGTAGGAGGIFNATTGFRVANAAAAGNVLRGDGTNFVSAQLGRSDLSGAPAKVTHLTSGTTYTVTAGAKAMFVQAVGGGGGGGGATGIASVYAAGGGGGGGGYAAVYIASPAASYSYAIGGGGSAGAAANGAGGTGGNTTFGGILTAGGGTGGAGATVPTAGSSSIVAGGNGGAGSVGDFLTVGQGGGAATMVPTSASASTMALAGFGGGSFFGGGVRGLAVNTDAQQNGATGTNYGTGGGGALSKSTSGFSGGVGAPGAIRVTEYF